MKSALVLLSTTLGEYALEIHNERRNNTRIATGKRKLILRCPRLKSVFFKQKYLDFARNWIQQLEQEYPVRAARLRLRPYKSDTVLFTVGGQDVNLHYREGNRSSLEGNLLTLPIRLRDEDLVTKNHQIPLLISRLLSKKYGEDVKSRLLSYASSLKLGKVNQVRLKYNTSNWGSCSSKGNINLSTRLLLCPIEVQDYVIVHELCHLKHPHHGISFWKEVARCIPDFKTHERWLKTKGIHQDF